MSNGARIAIIGAGWWSTYTHIPAVQHNPDAVLVALCDADSTRLTAAADAYNVSRRYTDYHHMLAAEQIDGVVIATPHATHFEIAAGCLARGKHVVVEKPMVLYARDARVLVETAHRNECQLIVGYPWHFSPHVLRARDIISTGVLGPIQFVSCLFASNILELLSGTNATDHAAIYPVHGPGNVYSQPHLSGGGMGHLQITHSAGLLFFISGLRARRVHSLMHNHGLALDLVDSMAVEFEGGALGTVGGTGNGLHRKLDLQIHCQHGAIDMDLVQGTTVIRGPGDHYEELDTLGGDAAGYPRFAPADNLVDIVLGRAPNGSPGEIGWRTVELLDAAYRSAALDGRAVAIADLYDN